MARSKTRDGRPRGNIEELPSGALRIRVYAGIDPLTKKPHYLRATIPPGPTAAKDAQAALTRFVNQVNEKRNPRTRATVNQLLDRWWEVGLDVDGSTRRGYATKLRKHVRPRLGTFQAGKVDAETLDAFYAELRRCRDHCDGKPFVSRHHTTSKHTDCKQCCTWHTCRPLSDSSIRQIHFGILRPAFGKAVRWKWISINPVDEIEPPGLPHPDPRPPTADDAASIVTVAWSQDPDWGTYIWGSMTTGGRRGEMCAIHWEDLELKLGCPDCETSWSLEQDICGQCGKRLAAEGVLTLRRAIAMDDQRRWYEKDTKTHQQRRVVLDPDTAWLFVLHWRRCQARLAKLGLTISPQMYVFSLAADVSTFVIPDTMTQRYGRLVTSLGINTTLKNLRHYSATELINAGVDVRAVAGRLGHGGGGATTLRVYTAWLAEADQRAATALSGRMPLRPDALEVKPQTPVINPNSPYRRVADQLRQAIQERTLPDGDVLPTLNEISAIYHVSVGTAHRAIALLEDEGLVRVKPGRRTVVI